MPQPDRSSPRLLWQTTAIVLSCSMASGAFASNVALWRLHANVPVMCAILAVDTLADRPADLAIATTCNAERYRLVLHHETGRASLRAARSSAGPVQIRGNAVIITSTQPGHALTTLELTKPVSAKQLSVTLHPI